MHKTLDYHAIACDNSAFFLVLLILVNCPAKLKEIHGFIVGLYLQPDYFPPHAGGAVTFRNSETSHSWPLSIFAQRGRGILAGITFDACAQERVMPS
jgi:hypothetical protein